jgi:hypothetical protein
MSTEQLRVLARKIQSIRLGLHERDLPVEGIRALQEEQAELGEELADLVMAHCPENVD